jgi:tRNA(Ile)-lysidine synthase
MASSRKLHLTDLTESVAAQIAPLIPSHSFILVGLSGGVDSVALLHLLHKLAPRFSWQLSALHVHHGISPNADAWSDFCANLCAGYNISLSIQRVDIAPLREHGIEAAARKLRHAVFAEQVCDFVALAHHADDQAETLLLQLLRGAGVRGTSAMAQFIERKDSLRLIRPLLHCSRQEIIDYAVAQNLRWIEDESNTDDKYPRNFLRHRVLPLLGERFPAYRDTLARSAQHFAEASLLLDELAQQDAEQAIAGATLSVPALQSLNPARAKNMLRYFLHSAGAPMPQAVQLEDMLRQLCDARRDASVCVNYGDWQVRRYLGRAYALRALGEFDNTLVLPWQGEDELAWPALNARLRFERMPVRQESTAMISLEKLQRAPVTLRLRRGGESLRPHIDAANRSLKNLLQEHHVPPWRRDRLPLLYCGNELVCVTGVAVTAGYLPGMGEMAVHFSISEH